MRNYMLVYSSKDLNPIGYTNFDFQSGKNSCKSTSGLVFTFGGIPIVWINIKQSYITNLTVEAKYTACEKQQRK